MVVVAKLAVSLEDFDASAQDGYKASLASAAGPGVSPDDVTLTISAASITVSASIRTTSAEAAQTAVGGVSNAIAATASGGGFMGLPVAEAGKE